MKIAFPIQLNSGLEGELAIKFYRAPKFAIYNIENKEFQLIEKTSFHFGGRITTLKLLNKNRVKVLVCKGINRRVTKRLANKGIEIYITKHRLVKDALKDYFLGEVL
ncbi:MAG: hypothetical protein FK730_13855 [Asgard group archaeon]|nr:hypothetical protein [Asgard group archaeon]